MLQSSYAADKLRISYSAVNATQAFLWVAQDRGIFAKHGLEGELLYINSGTMNIAALLGGSVQIAGGGPVSIEARLRGIKLTILGNPLPWLASNLVVHPDIKSIPDMAGKLAGISRFGSSTDQGFRYLFRKNGLNVDRDLKMLQMGGDSSRVAALKTGTIQYTFLGAAATDNARALGFRVLSTAQQMAIPFPVDFGGGRRRLVAEKSRARLPLHEMRHRGDRHVEAQPRRQRAHHRQVYEDHRPQTDRDRIRLRLLAHARLHGADVGRDSKSSWKTSAKNTPTRQSATPKNSPTARSSRD